MHSPGASVPVAPGTPDTLSDIGMLLLLQMLSATTRSEFWDDPESR